MIRSGGYDYKSGGGFCCFQISQISRKAANIVISRVKVMTGSGQMTAKQPSKNKEKQEGGIQLYCWRLSLSVLYDLETLMYTSVTSRPARLEARGEGRERGNLPGTTARPPVAIPPTGTI